MKINLTCLHYSCCILYLHNCTFDYYNILLILLYAYMQNHCCTWVWWVFMEHLMSLAHVLYYYVCTYVRVRRDRAHGWSIFSSHVDPSKNSIWTTTLIKPVGGGYGGAESGLSERPYCCEDGRSVSQHWAWRSKPPWRDSASQCRWKKVKTRRTGRPRSKIIILWVFCMAIAWSLVTYLCPFFISVCLL